MFQHFIRREFFLLQKSFASTPFFSLFGQLKGGVVKEVQQIQQPMRVLHNLLVMAEVEKLNDVGRELGLPCVLFGLIQDTVESSDFIKVATLD